MIGPDRVQIWIPRFGAKDLPPVDRGILKLGCGRIMHQLLPPSGTQTLSMEEKEAQLFRSQNSGNTTPLHTCKASYPT